MLYTKHILYLLGIAKIITRNVPDVVNSGGFPGRPIAIFPENAFYRLILLPRKLKWFRLLPKV
jgi:16S rRNA G527 N7-methylase RsmG